MESLRHSGSTLYWELILLCPDPAYMRRRVIKIPSKISQVAIIYWWMRKHGQNIPAHLLLAFLFSVFLLLIIKSAPENTLYGNEKTVNIPFPTAWFTKSFMKTVNFMSYFLDPSKGGTITEINTSPTRPWILSTSNYYLAHGDDQQVIAVTGRPTSETSLIFCFHIQTAHLSPSTLWEKLPQYRFNLTLWH